MPEAGPFTVFHDILLPIPIIQKVLVAPEGFEPPTSRLTDWLFYSEIHRCLTNQPLRVLYR